MSAHAANIEVSAPGHSEAGRPTLRVLAPGASPAPAPRERTRIGRALYLGLALSYTVICGAMFGYHVIGPWAAQMIRTM